MSTNPLRIALLASAFVPTWQWDFSRSLSLPAGSTFTRGSSGTFFNGSGTLVTAGSNVARFDYDPVNHASHGILIEQQSTNLYTYSADFTQGAWNKARASITANAASAPDGTNAAAKLVEDNTASNNHQLYQYSNVAASGVVYGASFFAKAGERTWCYIRFFGPAFTGSSAYFDLANGVLGTVESGLTAIIRAVGNGWYRISASMAATGTGSTPIVLSPTTGNGVQTYSGNGTSGFYVWGAQLETGLGTTSYIPTTSAAATRSQDVLSMPIANLSGWDATKGGVLTASFRLHARYPNNASGYDQTPIHIMGSGGSTDSWTVIAKIRNVDASYGYMTAGGVGQGTRSLATVPAEFTRVRLAWGFGPTQTALGRNTTLTSGSGSYATPTAGAPVIVYLGSYFNHGLGGSLEGVAHYRGERYATFAQRVSQ